MQVSLSAVDIARLQEAQDGMLRARARIDAALAEPRAADVVELYAAMRATVRRLQHELGLEERVRRQLRLVPQRRRVAHPGEARRPPAAPPPPIGPDAETQVLPRIPDPPRE